MIRPSPSRSAVTDTMAGKRVPSLRMYVSSYLSSIPREALNASASNPGAMGVASSSVSARARAITSCGSWMSAGVILSTTSAAA